MALCLHMFIAGVFVISAGAKVWGREAFAGFVAAVHDLGGVPVRFRVVVAVGTIGLEILAAGLQLAPTWVGTALAAGLLVAFTLVLIRGLRKRPGLACHCFGSGADAVAPRHVGRNIVLLAAAVGALGLGPAHGVGMAETALCGLVAAVGVGTVARLDDLAALIN
ncbi:MauE/DoxX family redox-associated membrane protein [Dactylosporangium sp. NPDC051485]|uniref:MauE/DoxX family redox-associated membrane protein n=1 Tax=Dactylosporangium sp. NPDC051485 TaxID=3154846 RepID=UPI00341FF965